MEIGPAQWLSRVGSNGYLPGGRILWRISWRIFVGLFHWEKIVVFGANLFPRFVADWLDRQIAGKIRQEGRQNPPRSQRAVPNKSARGENNSARVAGKSARPVKQIRLPGWRENPPGQLQFFLRFMLGFCYCTCQVGSHHIWIWLNGASQSNMLLDIPHY